LERKRLSNPPGPPKQNVREIQLTVIIGKILLQYYPSRFLAAGPIYNTPEGGNDYARKQAHIQK